MNEENRKIIKLYYFYNTSNNGISSRTMYKKEVKKMIQWTRSE